MRLRKAYPENPLTFSCGECQEAMGVESQIHRVTKDKRKTSIPDAILRAFKDDDKEAV